MRLKEPLYGLRSAGGHYILHLSLLITIIYIEYMMPNEED